jgi:beta,beta-carotene 9',10'-dioxygenase
VSNPVRSGTDDPEEAGHAPGFTAQSAECDAADLPVQGKIPAWLDGQLIRNCAAAFDRGSWHAEHWFDGLAMLCAFDFDGGRIGFRNRYLRTEEYRAAQSGTAPFAGAFRLPRRSLLARLRHPLPPGTDNANVAVGRVGTTTLALGEGRHHIAVDPATIATLGHHHYDDDLPADLSLIAHPQYDSARRELVSLAVSYRSREILAYRVADGENRRQIVARWSAPRLPYIHSFAMTPSKVVLIDHPLRVNPLNLAVNLIFGRAGFFDSFVWERSPTRLVVLDRDGARATSFVTDKEFFVFHTVSAFDDSGAVVVDVMALDGRPDFTQLRFDKLIASGPAPWPQLHRFRLIPGGAVEPSIIGTAQFDFPVVNETHPGGLPHRFVYGVGPHPATSRAFANAIFKLDTVTGGHRTWSNEGHYLSEAIFVPRAGGVAEDDGVLLAVALTGDTALSALLVIDAASLAEMGRAALPIRVPFGFHGRFFPRSS